MHLGRVPVNAVNYKLLQFRHTYVLIVLRNAIRIKQRKALPAGRLQVHVIHWYLCVRVIHACCGVMDRHRVPGAACVCLQAGH